MFRYFSVCAFNLLFAAIALFAQTSNNGFSSQIISSQWNQAVGLTFNSSGTQMFVWERGGKVWLVKNNIKSLIIDITEEVGAYGDLGLLGFALDPQFDNNGYFYLFYTVDRHHLLDYGTTRYSATTSYNYTATIQRLTRFTATPISNGYSVNSASRKILIGATRFTGIPAISAYHGPGSLLFGRDGSLLVSSGDGASASSADTGSASDTYYSTALSNGIITSAENVGAFRSQLLESYCGKILRIDPITGNGIPGNPYYDPANPGSIRSKIWTIGLRNPFRMSLKPGTGSINPADGNPGTIYLGDVGHLTWEELDVVDKGGINLGWPIFEGLTFHAVYPAKNVFNYNAPNPAYGSSGCTQQYFYFRNLIKQETASGTADFTNPCNNQPIPSGITTFIHKRPIIDWRHGTGPSRSGTFTNGAASVINIGAAGSPVSGPQFGGNCAVGGIFYTHDDFPAEYANTYMFADYTKHWIRTLTTDAKNAPASVSNVIDTGSIVALAIHPSQGGLYYIDFTSTIKKLTYNNINQQPVAVASADKTFGMGPLSVQFTGDLSSDPEGASLTYLWNFGDGESGNIANPVHVFSPPDNTSAKYTVILTVTDAQGTTDQDSVVIYVNNTPPTVTITSPAAGTLYPITTQGTFPLRASVTDNEDNAANLSYRWEVVLHHDYHFHPESLITSPEGTVTTAPLGCGIEIYYYRIRLTVTDGAGLSTTKETQLNPYCDKVTGYTLVNADNEADIQPLNNGTVVNLRAMPTKRFNIRANTSPTTVGKVIFDLTGSLKRNFTDQIWPYALFGDNNGNYSNWNATAGNYTLKATPYAPAVSGGTAGTGLAINFSITKNIGVASGAQLDTLINSVNAANTNMKIRYYPNPFQSEFTLRLQNPSNQKMNLRVTDVYGRTLLKFPDVYSSQRIVAGKQLAAGVYILTVESGETIESFKLVKVR